MPDRFKRRSIRLHDYDYSQAGEYFVTMCAWRKESFFGGINNGKMKLSKVGQIAISQWMKMPKIMTNLQIDCCVLMPNHLHSIITFDDDSANHRRRGLINQAPTATNWSLMQNPKQTLGKVIRYYKAMTTKIVHNASIGFAWQRNYYDHIIRNERELNAIGQYILYNPLNWHLDMENQLSKNFEIDPDTYFSHLYI